jgi:signal peptidase II
MFFNLVLVWNRGISFGVLSSSNETMQFMLSAVSMTIVAALAAWLQRTNRILLGTSLGAIIGGALGNVVDRLQFRAVVDFLDFHLLGYHWPSFNFADSAISIGMAFLIIDEIFSKCRRQANYPETGADHL